MRTVLSFIHQNSLSGKLRLGARLIGPLGLLMAAAIFASCGAISQAPIDQNSAQINKLTGSDGSSFFGGSVAIYGDAAIVGATEDNQGSAYIFSLKTLR